MGGNNVDLNAESKITPQAANQLQALNEAETAGAEGTEPGTPAAGEEADPASWATLGANVNDKIAEQQGGDDAAEAGEGDDDEDGEDDADSDKADGDEGTDDGEGPGDGEDDGVGAPSADDQAVAEAAGESHDEDEDGDDEE